MIKIPTPFLLVTLTIIIGYLSGCQTPAQEVAPNDSKPNIVYILADDLGYGELGSYGQQLIETPNIDQLAQSGMRFTQHYSGSPVCAPSRCVLLTGKHTGHAYIRGNDEWKERGNVWDYKAMFEDPNLEGQRPLPKDSVSVASILNNAGYQTAIVGKWGLGGPMTEGIPNNHGFDFFYGYICQRQAHTLYPKHLWKNREKIVLPNKMVPPRTKLAAGAEANDPKSYADFQLEAYAPELMLEETLNFLDKQQVDQPFFLYFASPLPHVPLQAPQKWVAHYQEKFGPETPYEGQKGYFPNFSPRATYAAMISYLDEQVGAIIAKLKEKGVYDNTLILFSSDNGPTYVGGADTPFFDSGHPFECTQGRGKGYVYEGGIRVPFIASWPGKIKAGSESNHISAFWDMLPTFCEISQQPIPPNRDGISLLPELMGQKQSTHKYLYWEFPAYQGQQAIRMGKWKAIRQNIFKDNLEIELYDLSNDPTETTDISNQYPDLVHQFDSLFTASRNTPAIDRFKIKQLGD